MATTDAKPGFRLPWSPERAAPVSTEGTTDLADATAGTEPVTDGSAPGPDSQEHETTAMIDAAPASQSPQDAVDAEGAPVVSEPSPAGASTDAPPAPSPAAQTPARRPNKFMADLTKAMQAAAEAARADALERLGADAKSVVETIHADSTGEATDLRKRADDDVAAVREWSKNEIARIRDETDERIAHRKEKLEREIEEHAAAIERRIERVQQRVAAFEAEMSAYFERLLAEEDPTRFAALAEAMPEPPALDAVGEWAPPTPEAAPAPEVETSAAAAESPVIEGTVEPAAAPAAEPAEDPATDTGPAAQAEAPAEAPTEADAAEVPADPRLSALGLDQGFAAAEAEALAYAPDPEPIDEGPAPELGDEMIAARLAGIASDGEPAATPAQTRLVVVGLVSVASIAGFKRSLSRMPGVSHVGVTSGPDGEFVFTVDHDPATDLRDAVPALPGFSARITGDAEDGLAVTATDPETEH